MLVRTYTLNSSCHQRNQTNYIEDRTAPIRYPKCSYRPNWDAVYQPLSLKLNQLH